MANVSYQLGDQRNRLPPPVELLQLRHCVDLIKEGIVGVGSDRGRETYCAYYLLRA